MKQWKLCQKYMIFTIFKYSKTNVALFFTKSDQLEITPFFLNWQVVAVT